MLIVHLVCLSDDDGEPAEQGSRVLSFFSIAQSHFAFNRVFARNRGNITI